MKNENKLTMAKVSNRTKSIIFTILMVFAALMTIGSIGVMVSPPDADMKKDVLSYLLLAIAFLALTVFCILKKRKLKEQKRALASYREYIARLSDDREKSLTTLAAQMNLPVEKVQSHIEMLIRMKLINNAYIDKATKTLVLPEYGLYEKAPETVYAAVKCDCCGGNNVLPMNTVGTCQYCGSPIVAKR